jgi:hypothetical protein
MKGLVVVENLKFYIPLFLLPGEMLTVPAIASCETLEIELNQVSENLFFAQKVP